MKTLQFKLHVEYLLLSLLLLITTSNYGRFLADDFKSK